MKTITKLTTHHTKAAADANGKVTTNPLQPVAADSDGGELQMQQNPLQMAGEEEELLQKKENPLQLKYTGDNPLKPIADSGNPMRPAAATQSINPFQLGESTLQLKFAKSDLSANQNTYQLRGENPHAQADTHKDWELTAHHIVAHSKLEKSYEKLNAEQKKEIYKYAIPDVLTKTMLENMKVEIADTPDARATLRARLVADDNGDINGVRLEDIRSSFFLWQGGNQFMGPNTSIRTEPSPSKDDLDSDGQHLSPLAGDKFGELETLGNELDPSKENTVILAKLKAILDITKNVTPNIFDESKWVEITSAAEVERLAAAVDREHLVNYAFFKAANGEIGEEKKYDKIISASGDYFYDTVKITAHAKGTNLYIPFATSKDIKKTTSIETKLTDLLAPATLTASAKNTVISNFGDLLTLNAKNFNAKGFPDGIPFVSKTADTVTVATGLLNNKKLIKATLGETLYKYLSDKGAPTSTYLPKALYDTANQLE